jgi:hypothetical protein
LQNRFENMEIKLKQKNIHGIVTKNYPGKYIVYISMVMKLWTIDRVFFPTEFRELKSTKKNQCLK